MLFPIFNCFGITAASMVMRRFHARGRGRSARIEKWFSHLKIVVAERAEDAGQEAA